MSTDGTVAITALDFSGDAKLAAYACSKSGSDWNKIKIRNVETGEDYAEILEGVKWSATTWTSDNKGFFYSVRIHSAEMHFIFCLRYLYQLYNVFVVALSQIW